MLFFIGVTLAFVLHWGLRRTRWGLMLRLVGDHAESARALGYRSVLVRIAATAAGGFLAGIGGAYLSLYYPGGPAAAGDLTASRAAGDSYP